MTEKTLTNNQAIVIGEIVSDFIFSHEMFGEKFYLLKLKVNRLSDSKDTIPVLVSSWILDVTCPLVGHFLQVRGQFRSYNKRSRGRQNHLMLTLFAKEVKLLAKAEYARPNVIFLDGYVCKVPVYRRTPLGREIADVLLAVNRSYGKSDYIPCICWGRNARYAKTLAIGSRIRLWGRIQSRDYQKRLGEDRVVIRTAYEVSISRMEHLADEPVLAGMVADSASLSSQE